MHVWVVLHIETTGLSPELDHVIHIAAQFFYEATVGATWVPCGKYVSLARVPGDAPLSEAIVRCTGGKITDTQLRAAPTAEEVLKALCCEVAQVCGPSGPCGTCGPSRVIWAAHNGQHFAAPFLARYSVRVPELRAALLSELCLGCDSLDMVISLRENLDKHETAMARSASLVALHDSLALPALPADAVGAERGVWMLTHLLQHPSIIPHRLVSSLFRFTDIIAEFLEVGTTTASAAEDSPAQESSTSGLAWTNEQHAIIFGDINAHTVVRAGAGCAKTTTMAGRIAHLVRSGVPASAIYLLAFTRTAAADMRERLFTVGVHASNSTDDTAGKNCAKTKTPLLDQVHVGTIDSTAHSVLRSFDPDRLKRDAHGFKEYKTVLLAALRENSPGLRDWRVAHVIVDEAQDLTETYFQILAQLHQRGAIITLVGDDGQNIYGFNGAHSEYLNSAMCFFSPCRCFSLSTNFRSTQPIVAAANACIRGNHMINRPDMTCGARTQRKNETEQHKTEHETGQHKAGQHKAEHKTGSFHKEPVTLSQTWLTHIETPRAIGFADNAQELQFVVRSVKELHYTTGIPFSEIAVVARNYDQGLFLLENELRREKVPCVLSGSEQARRRRADPAQALMHQQLFEEVVKDTPAPNGGGPCQLLSTATSTMSTMSSMSSMSSGEVLLSTIHAVKGLEFSAVIVMGSTDKNIPGKALRSAAQTLARSAGSASFQDDEQQCVLLETEREERRIFYTAVTRAKQHLAFTFSIEQKNSFVSRFLAEINAHVQWHGVVPQFPPQPRRDDKSRKTTTSAKNKMEYTAADNEDENQVDASRAISSCEDGFGFENGSTDENNTWKTSAAGRVSSVPLYLLLNHLVLQLRPESIHALRSSDPCCPLNFPIVEFATFAATSRGLEGAIYWRSVHAPLLFDASGAAARDVADITVPLLQVSTLVSLGGDCLHAAADTLDTLMIIPRENAQDYRVHYVRLRDRVHAELPRIVRAAPNDPLKQLHLATCALLGLTEEIAQDDDIASLRAAIEEDANDRLLQLPGYMSLSLSNDTSAFLLDVMQQMLSMQQHCAQSADVPVRIRVLVQENRPRGGGGGRYRDPVRAKQQLTVTLRRSRGSVMERAIAAYRRTFREYNTSCLVPDCVALAQLTAFVDLHRPHFLEIDHDAVQRATSPIIESVYNGVREGVLPALFAQCPLDAAASEQDTHHCAAETDLTLRMPPLVGGRLGDAQFVRVHWYCRVRRCALHVDADKQTGDTTVPADLRIALLCVVSALRRSNRPVDCIAIYSPLSGRLFTLDVADWGICGQGGQDAFEFADRVQQQFAQTREDAINRIIHGHRPALASPEEIP